jgi:hypothetical protein
MTSISKYDVESFAPLEHARLMQNENIASQRVREIAYRLWQKERCPDGDALHWFAAKAIFDSKSAAVATKLGRPTPLNEP